jgi:anti-sigma-K factor RskA
MRKIILTAAAIAIASTGMASAASARKVKRPVVAAVAVKVAPIFKAADTDSSRTLNTTEFGAAGGNADNFGLIDANSNGELGFFELLRAAVARFLSNRG